MQSNDSGESYQSQVLSHLENIMESEAGLDTGQQYVAPPPDPAQAAAAAQQEQIAYELVKEFPELEDADTVARLQAEVDRRAAAINLPEARLDARFVQTVARELGSRGMASIQDQIYWGGREGLGARVLDFSD